jgi:hypothetical protein
MNLPGPPGPPKGAGDPEQQPGADRGSVGGTPERARPTRKQLDDIFGDVLPTVTQDELDDERAGGDDRDRWYRDNRPPHHG